MCASEHTCLVTGCYIVALPSTICGAGTTGTLHPSVGKPMFMHASDSCLSQPLTVRNAVHLSGSLKTSHLETGSQMHKETSKLCVRHKTDQQPYATSSPEPYLHGASIPVRELHELCLRADRAAASAGQSGLMALYDTLFAMMDLQASQLLVTPRDFRDENFKVNLRETTEELLSVSRVIPVFNENDAISDRSGADKVIL